MPNSASAPKEAKTELSKEALEELNEKIQQAINLSNLKNYHNITANSRLNAQRASQKRWNERYAYFGELINILYINKDYLVDMFYTFTKVSKNSVSEIDIIGLFVAFINYLLSMLHILSKPQSTRRQAKIHEIEEGGNGIRQATPLRRSQRIRARSDKNGEKGKTLKKRIK